MHKLSTKKFAVLALLLGAVIFASGASLARDHGDDTATGAVQHDDPHAADVQATDTHATDAQTADHTSGHGEPNTTHDEHAADPHATGHGDDMHGAEGHGEGHGDAHGGGHSSIPHLYNLVSGWIAPFVPEAVAHNLEAFIDPIYSLTVVILLSLFFVALARQLSARKPGRRQAAAEIIFGGLYSLFQAIIGPTARRYTPFLGTLFIFILCNNLAGIIPLGHAATSSFNATTFALGGLTFLYVQGIALKENGLLGYLHHMAGSPKTGMDWGFSLLLFPLHLLGELIKPVSLALRLFGNIFGEDTLVATMVILGYLLMKALLGFLPETAMGFIPGLPLQLPFYFLGLLSSTIQALVFTLLATVYIALWLPHGDHGHDEAHGH
ncbi:F0F1 ATP synthase subunit A [bacterium]|nr:F0F1 ATP synthase subunit A [bacterium]